MRAGQASLSAMVGVVIVMAAGASWAEDVNVQILKLRNDKPLVLYDCTTKARMAPPWTPEKLPAKAVASNPPNGWLRVKLNSQDGTQREYCVEDFRVVTDQEARIKAECSSVLAQRNAGTRGVGENCEPKPKPKH